MDQISVCKAKNLQADAKHWVEGLVGRSLLADEEVAVFVLPPRSKPSDADRAAAAGRLSSILDKTAENLGGVSDAEYDDALREALQQSRGRGD
jgi:hypothetical protein